MSLESQNKLKTSLTFKFVFDIIMTSFKDDDDDDDVL